MELDTKIHENPLVSIIVITYNSSKYVLETLESARAQTYQNIELIVSDDCSTDDTVEICRKWIEENKDRFVRTELITVEKNTGIAPNCNRGLHTSNGDWVKFIAGDDILMEECISVFVNFAKTNTGKLFFSDIECFFTNAIDEVEYQIMVHPDKFMNLPPRMQMRTLLNGGGIIKGPSSFLNKELVLFLGGFEENFPFLEDHPFWIKATLNGFQLHRVPYPLVKYRIHPESIFSSFKNGNGEKSRMFYDSYSNFYKKVAFDLLWKEKKLIYYIHFKIQLLQLEARFENKKYIINPACLNYIDLIYIKGVMIQLALRLRSILKNIVSPNII